MHMQLEQVRRTIKELMELERQMTTKETTPKNVVTGPDIEVPDVATPKQEIRYYYEAIFVPMAHDDDQPSVVTYKRHLDDNGDMTVVFERLRQYHHEIEESNHVKAKLQTLTRKAHYASVNNTDDDNEVEEVSEE